MHTVEYKRLSRRSDDLSDEFYRCVSEWARGGKASRDHCLNLAQDYEQAIVEQLSYLRRIPDAVARDHAIQSCERFHTLLSNQVRLLQKNDA